jgi:uncharacterized protein YkwD
MTPANQPTPPESALACGVGLCLAVLVVRLVAGLGTPGAAFANEDRPLVVVDARVIWTEAVLEDDGLLYGLEVQQVLHGAVPGSTIAGRLVAGKSQPSLLTGDPVAQLWRVTMRPRGDGDYDLLGAFPIPAAGVRDDNADDDEEATTSGGLWVAPADRAALPLHPRPGGVPNRVRSTLEDTSFEQEVVELVNHERATYGGIERPPLKRVTLLDVSSEGHSSRMASEDFFGHCDMVNFSTPEERMTAAGYIWNQFAENISGGPSTPNLVMYAAAPFGWMNSEPHRNAILDPHVREIGIGYVFSGDDEDNVTIGDQVCQVLLTNQNGLHHYWTQNFGRRNGVYPLIINREASSTNDRMGELYIYNSGATRAKSS